jgi:hypothetical protein
MVKLGSDIKVVWITSAVRCGSMWVFNVTRRIVRAAGLEVLPSLVPQLTQAMAAAAREGLLDSSTNRVRVVKVHGVCSDLPPFRFIVPRRDIRDSVVSYMRFMHRDFEQAMEWARSTLRNQRRYDALPRDRTLMINYTDIIVRPTEIAHMIATFLEAPVDRRATDVIARDLSKEKVARLVEQKEEDLKRRSRQGQPIARNEVVVLGPANLRAFDTATGFQSGHVSNYQEGSWKTILTADQQSRLEALIKGSV